MTDDRRVWYYAKRGKQFGPLSIQDLVNLAGTQELLPQDLIWHEGMTRWASADQIPEFSSVYRATLPPPLSPAAPPARQMAVTQPVKSLKSAVKSQRPPKKNAKRIFLLIAAVIIVISPALPLFTIFYSEGHPHSQYLPRLVWGYALRWDFIIAFFGAAGMTTAIVDLAMPSTVRSITRWIHWPLYTLIVIFLVGGLLYTYESGIGFNPIPVLGFVWMPSFALLVLAFASFGLISSVRIWTKENVQHPF